MMWFAVAALVLVLGGCASTTAQEQDPFAHEFGALVEQVRAEGDLPPGFALIVTRGEEVLYEEAYGLRDAASDAPLTLDTPIISASISKSHIALLAARLDAQGVLSLDATLHDVWPELTLPAPLDPRTISVRRLLSHSSGMNDNWLDLRSNHRRQCHAGRRRPALVALREQHRARLSVQQFWCLPVFHDGRAGDRSRLARGAGG
jgi:CubicO group peptidase (beta-lactamase class C family)